MADHPLLFIDDLRAAVDGTEILKGVTLTVRLGEIHALMGPNGSGKSTLANVLMGHPAYTVTGGRVMFEGQDVTRWKPDARGRAGMFLAFQYPEEIPGVSVVNFLRSALSNRTGTDYTVLELRLKVMDHDARTRHGGIVRRPLPQRGVFRRRAQAKRSASDGRPRAGPRGARRDGLRTPTSMPCESFPRVCRQSQGPNGGFLIITHYLRMLEHITPDAVHVFVDGRVVESGGTDLARRIEIEGYEAFRAPVG